MKKKPSPPSGGDKVMSSAKKAPANAEANRTVMLTQEEQAALLSCTAEDGGDAPSQKAPETAQPNRTVMLSQEEQAALLSCTAEDGGDAPSQKAPETAQPNRTVMLSQEEQAALLSCTAEDSGDKTPHQNAPESAQSNRTVMLSQAEQADLLSYTIENPMDDFDASRTCLNCFEDRGGDTCPHCGWVTGTPPEQAYRLYPGTRLDNRYIIGTVIDFGGFGAIYRAWDTALNIVVAIKELFPAGLVSRIPGDAKISIFSGEKEKQFNDQLNRFLDEARNLAKFCECPNIVRVFRSFEANGSAYIVMEHLDGANLKDYARDENNNPKAIDADEAVRLLLPMTDALELIHKSGIIHRDVSPDNIFYTTDGQVKLLDLGAARLSKDSGEDIDVVVKTGYAAPEQYGKNSVQGVFTDIYGLGATLYRLLTGIVPVEASDRGEGEDKISLPAPSQTGAQVKPNLDKTVMTAMALEPSLRFASMRELRDALLGKKKVYFPEQTRRRRRVRRGLSFVAAVLMLAGSAAGYFAYEKYRPMPLSQIVPSPDSISVWLPVDAATGFETETMRDLADRFCEVYAGINIEFFPVNASEYGEEITRAYNDNAMPELFFTDGVNVDLSLAATDLSEVLTALDMTAYPVLSRYDELYPSRKEIPLSFDVSMVYANTNAAQYNQIDVPEQITSLDDLKSGAQWDVQNACYSAYFSMFGGISQNGFDEAKSAAALDALLEARAAEGGESPAQSPMERFSNDGLTYLFAGTKQLSEISQSMSGVYAALPVLENSAYYGTFHDTWAISSLSSPNRKNIAKLFLIYMLSEYAQTELYMGGASWIPVNGDAASGYLNTFSELIFLEPHLPYITFGGEYAGAKSETAARFESMLQNPDNLPPEALREELWNILLDYRDLAV